MEAHRSYCSGGRLDGSLGAEAKRIGREISCMFLSSGLVFTLAQIVYHENLTPVLMVEIPATGGNTKYDIAIL